MGTQSAARLAAGPYAVERTQYTWIDSTRPTDSNGDYEGAPDRKLDVALWSHYVFVAASFPLTTFNAPGGPNVNDVINQPRDVSFLIDRVLALGPDE